MLVVIAVSVLVITVLSGLARVSLRRSLEAADAERSLQIRWGALSLQRAMVKKMPKTFDEREERFRLAELPLPPPTIRDAITLGGVTFDLLLGDEGAKLNVNTIYHLAGPSRTEQSITQVTGQLPPGILRLSPAMPPLGKTRSRSSITDDPIDAPEETAFPRAFRSWGEVFDLNSLRQIDANEVALVTMTQQVTCWGGSSINVRRASDEVVVETLGVVIQDGQARSIIEALRSNPTMDLQSILRREIRDQDDRRDAAGLLAETSTHFSLWIDASTPSGGRLRTFTTVASDEEGLSSSSKFAH